MPELLVEIGCEELPGGACREAIEQAPRLIAEALEEARVPAGQASVWVSPRRIAVSVADVAEERPGRTRSARGPAEQAAFADGEPTKAALGFARGQGVDVGELVVREQDGRRFVFADVDEPATSTAELVPDVVRHLVDGLRFGAAMRWGDGTGLRFSRPVRWLLAKHGGATIPFELHGLTAGDGTRGHRALGGPAQIDEAAGYREALRAVSVVVDHEDQR
ncbi:MAG: glycine--tRNA ligase subunit beta, partial [Miltoncostaeaceae bacterium]